jgi:hypothetical protein
MTAAGFDVATARHGIDMLTLAFDRWDAFMKSQPPLPLPSDETVATYRLRADGHVADVVRWVRSVDDYFAGRDGTTQEQSSRPVDEDL